MRAVGFDAGVDLPPGSLIYAAQLPMRTARLIGLADRIDGYC